MNGPGKTFMREGSFDASLNALSTAVAQKPCLSEYKNQSSFIFSSPLRRDKILSVTDEDGEGGVCCAFLASYFLRSRDTGVFQERGRFGESQHSYLVFL